MKKIVTNSFKFLPERKQRIIINDIMDAGLMNESGLDYEIIFIRGKNNHNGAAKRIYQFLLGLDKDGFEQLLNSITKGVV